MPIGLTLLFIVLIFLIFGFGESIYKKLGLSKALLLIFCSAFIISYFMPETMLQETFGINFFVVGITLAFIVYMLVTTDAGKYAARTFSAGLVTGAALLCLTYVVPPTPQGFINQPYILYGITGGLIAFFLAENTAGVAVASMMGLLLLDMSVTLLASGGRMPYVWGSGTAYNGLILAIFTGCSPAVIFAYFRNKKPVSLKTKLHPRANYNFEIAKDMQLSITTVREGKKNESKEQQ